MKIGIDIDDTISETFETLLPYAQKYTIEVLKRKSKIDMNQDFLDHFYIIKMMGWNKEEAMKFWLMYYDEILKEINIKKFAAKTMKALKEKGHTIYLITARWSVPGADTIKTTKEWLKKNNVPYDELVMNVSDKAELVKEKKIDLFIDDSFENCQTIVEKTDATVYMMNTRMNENLNPNHVKRVYSWCEIEDLIG